MRPQPLHTLFYTFVKSLAMLYVASYTGRNILVHILAIILTALLIVSGFDWHYFLLVNTFVPKFFLFSADILGFLFPIIVPIALIIYGKKKKGGKHSETAYVIVKSIIVAFFVTLTYKAFTGRISPPHHGQLIDLSREFNFGFFDYSVIGGWPSSHTAVIFSIAACVTILFPRMRTLQITLYVFAMYIGLGVTFGFHWLSEFVAGALIGTMVGRTVAKNAVQTSLAHHSLK